MTYQRFERQQRLREVGKAGQLRLASESVTCQSGSGEPYARAYLQGAGLPVSAGSREQASFAHASAFQHPAALALAAGAHDAVTLIVARLRAPK